MEQYMSNIRIPFEKQVVSFVFIIKNSQDHENVYNVHSAVLRH